MSLLVDSLAADVGRGVTVIATGGTVAVGVFGAPGTTAAMLAAVAAAPGIEGLAVPVGNADGDLLFMTGASRTGSSDVTGD
jgi:hypothetical protein